MEPKKPLDPGTGMGRITGKCGCEMGMWLGTVNGCCPAATKGGVEHNCSAWAVVLLPENKNKN